VSTFSKRGLPGVTPIAIWSTAGTPQRPWLTSVKLRSSNASPRIN